MDRDKMAVVDSSGIEQIIKAGFVSYEPMPMLDNIFDRLSRTLSVSLRGYTNDIVDISAGAMRSLRFGDFMNDVPDMSTFILFRAKQWNGYGMVILDSSLCCALINMLMGGDKKKLTDDKRPLTNLERDLVSNVVRTVLRNFQDVFRPIAEVDFVFDRIESSRSLVNIVRPSSASVVADFGINFGYDYGGTMSILLPYATLETVRGRLTHQFGGDGEGNDSIWEAHLLSEIMSVSLKLSANLGSTEMSLDEFLKLKPGSVFRLPSGPNGCHGVVLECDGREVFSGRLGRLKNSYAVTIEDVLTPPDHGLMASGE